MDVSDADALVAWLDGAEAGLDAHPLVGVFANAGVGGPNTWGKDDRWEEIIRINLTGTYNTLMACGPHLKKAEGVTHALVTSSVLARFGVPGQTAYVASKTGLMGLVRSLAVEWSPEGVMVNALCPGWVETEMAQNSIQAMADAQGISYEASKAQQEAILAGRPGQQPDEMAQWVNFLFSGLAEARQPPARGDLHRSSPGRQQRVLDGMTAGGDGLPLTHETQPQRCGCIDEGPPVFCT